MFLAPHSAVAAQEEFTEAGKTDFDTFLEHLAPHGSWQKHAQLRWIYIPHAALDKQWRPYSNGQWRYTDYGWYWDSPEPFAFACYHYGFWWQIADGTWGWVPDTRWDPATVEWRKNSTCWGWRPRRANASGEWLEDDAVTAQKFWQWTFIEHAQLFQTLTTETVKPLDENESILPLTKPCTHAYEIAGYGTTSRVGPDPRLAVAAVGRTNMMIHTLRMLPQLDTARPESFPERFLFVYKPKFAQATDGLFMRTKLWHERGKSGKTTDIDSITSAVMETIVDKKVQALRNEKEKEQSKKASKEKQPATAKNKPAKEEPASTAGATGAPEKEQVAATSTGTNSAPTTRLTDPHRTHGPA